MANAEKFNTHIVICEGGLNSNRNHLMLSQRSPGAAATLMNFETSLFGGYRRIDGFEPLNLDHPEVDPTNAEGKILGVAIYGSVIMTARKQISDSTYNFYAFDQGEEWDPFSTGLILSSVGVNKIRHSVFNFDSTDKIVFVDGVNPMSIFDGATWTQAVSTESSPTESNPGGDQIVDQPSMVCVFQNHIFVAGDPSFPNIVAHSAPLAEYDWTAANGAGQIPVGFKVKQIKPFRDELFVFGETSIKKIVVNNTSFLLKDVTLDIGCLATDSVQEVNGDLVFLSQDGVRTVAATERFNDVELGSLSKNIQQDLIDTIRSADFTQIESVLIRRKSQIRFFFSNENLATDANIGFIGCIKGSDSVERTDIGWEWGRLLGIRTSSTDSKYIGADEYVLHGDYNGIIYRQEVGSSFDGENITATYTTPYLDLSDPFIRKTLHKISVFLRPEGGDVAVNSTLQFNWDLKNVINPESYLLESGVTGAVYGQAVYNQSLYASTPAAVVLSNIEGSGEAFRLTFTSSDTNPPYSIQGLVFEYAVNGRK